MVKGGDVSRPGVHWMLFCQMPEYRLHQAYTAKRASILEPTLTGTRPLVRWTGKPGHMALPVQLTPVGMQFCISLFLSRSLISWWSSWEADTTDLSDSYSCKPQNFCNRRDHIHLDGHNSA